MNKHKNMVLFSLWLTKAEAESIKQISEGENLSYGDYSSVLGEILQEAIIRGDLNKS
jgi:hypothetical protein